MQSFLQYRRSGRAVEEEEERHAENLRSNIIQRRTRYRHSPSQSSIDSTSDSDPATPKSKELELPDLERDAEPSNGETQEQGLPRGVYAANLSDLDNQDDMQDLRPQRTTTRTAENPVSERNPSPAPSSQRANPTAALHPSLSTTTTRTALGHTLTGVAIRNRTTKEGEKGNLVFVVGYQGENDVLNPHNWGVAIRVWCTMLIASIGFIVGMASAIDSSALKYAAKEFGVSEVVESLATGIFLIGFGAGALFAGPLSETVGRNPVYIATMSLYMIFIMAAALAPNIGAQLVFRFLAGFFGSTPLVCAGGSISDLWSPMERVLAFPVFANAAFTGPVLGPVLGGYIVSSKVLDNWRWTEWFTLIISGVILAGVVLSMPETYPPTLLRWRAQHLRRVTGDERFRAQVEIRSQTFLARLKVALYRPFLLTFSEPIIALLALYLTVIYIVLFAFLDGYEYIFAEIHHTSEGVTGLCFLGIAIGLCFASGLVPLIYKWAKRDLKKIKEDGGDRLPPEFRLWFAMLGGAVAIPVSLFWMGWTSYPWISIWSPLAASVLFGYGVLCVFISSYQYIIDSYEIYAASALASVTLIRYIAAGAMTVVGIPFYKNIGVHWTLTILGGISALLVPVPYVFYKYGRRIRAKSKYAVNAG